MPTLKPLTLTDTLRCTVHDSPFTTSEAGETLRMADALWAGSGKPVHVEVFVPVLRQAKDQTAEYSTF